MIVCTRSSPRGGCGNFPPPRPRGSGLKFPPRGLWAQIPPAGAAGAGFPPPRGKLPLRARGAVESHSHNTEFMYIKCIQQLFQMTLIPLFIISMFIKSILHLFYTTDTHPYRFFDAYSIRTLKHVLYIKYIDIDTYSYITGCVYR